MDIEFLGQMETIFFYLVQGTETTMGRFEECPKGVIIGYQTDHMESPISKSKEGIMGYMVVVT